MLKKQRLHLHSRIILVIGFSTILWILVSPIKTTQFNSYDEGFAVFGAARVMSGDIPYKDFWAIYPPGQFYTLALLFKIFGANLLVERIYDTFMRLIISIGLYLIVSATSSQLSALLACIIAALLLSAVGFYAYAVIPALALGIFAISSLIRYMEMRSWYWLVVSGVLIGGASFFRWDIALYFAISLVVGVLSIHVWKFSEQTFRVDNRFIWHVVGQVSLVLGPLLTCSFFFMDLWV